MIKFFNRCINLLFISVKSMRSMKSIKSVYEIYEKYGINKET